MKPSVKFKILLRSVLLSVFWLSSALMADDTEIFFGQAAGTEVDNPNLLFILDTSGSMTELDGGNTSRIDRLKEAMTTIIDQSSSFNVGLMSFNGHQQGGPVRIPIGNLEGVSDSTCPETGCPDELVISRPRNGSDDATENEQTGIVLTNETSLIIGDLTPDPGDTGIPDDAELIEGQAVIAATVTEAFRLSDSVNVHQNDQVTDNWFFKDVAQPHSAQIMGYRFTGVDIPVGAIITSASLEFTLLGASNHKGDVSAYISAEATATPETYPDASLIPTPDPFPLLGERTLTSKFIAWPDIEKGNNLVLATPDLKEVVQEVIGLPGWAQGNDISFIVEPFDSYIPSSMDQRVFHGIGGTALQQPIMKYTYFIPNDSTAGTIVADATSHLTELFNPTDTTYTGDSSSDSVDLFYNGAEYEPADYALRFENIDIPENATITGAYLSMSSTSATNSFNVNVSAELSATPAEFDAQELNTRDNSIAFVEWTLPDTVGVTSSPDLTTLIDELRALPDWTDDASVVLRMSPGSDYLHDGTMLQTIETSEGDEKPVLNISWNVEDSFTGPTASSQLAGIRFPNIHIPPQATIVSAVIEFNSASAIADSAAFEIRGEATDNAVQFSGTNLDISSRSQTLAGANWEVDPWDTVGNEFSSADVSAIVQEIVNRSGWCGGNAMSMFINGSGSREAIAYDTSTISAPALKITYSPDSVPTGAYCSNRSSVIGIGAASDDATENNTTGAVALTPDPLNLVADNGQLQTIGLRFRGVPIPQGTTLVNATIELTAATDIPAGASATIAIDNVDDSPAFASAPNNLTDRAGADTTTWTTIPAASAGDSVFTPDISNLIEGVIGRAGWAEGNALTVTIQANSGSANTSFETFASVESMAARLILYYQGESTVTGTVFRENLKNAVNELPADDGTPIVDAFYEGANYYLGRPVEYGTRRGWGGTNAVNFRVSHPDSYTGGTVSREPGCTDADLNNWDCRSEEILGNPVYISPINAQCQQNHIVLLSDGEATSNTSAADVRALAGLGACSMADDDDSDEACGRELAFWLANSDHSDDYAGQQRIITHTIGFNLDTPAFLQNIATQGGGQFYSAESAADLLAAFRNIFDNVSRSDATFVAPSASINQFNRLKNREDIYFSLFKPETTARWSGNLKRYKLQGTAGQTAEIVDDNGDPAINPDTGEFIPGSVSVWSSGSDGGQVAEGGAAAELAANFTRNVLTYTGGEDLDLKAAANLVLFGNQQLLPEYFDLPPTKAAEPDYLDNLIKWASGLDVKDENGNGIVDENRAHMGDPLHAQPVVLNYTPNGTEPVSVVYMATNEGYLHAIDHEHGTEQFAFIPKELLKNLHHFYDNAVASSRIYGLDGGITTWIKDVDKDGVIDEADGDEAYLYVGMRRGGRNYYALDVTDPQDPKYLWHIEGDAPVEDTDSTTANGDWTDLGQSWSTPSKTRIRDGAEIKDVLIFGGGYDPNNHDELNDVPPGIDADGNRKNDFLGRGIYIADAETGELLWKPDFNDSDYNSMQYSVPSDLRVIDITGDGLVDQIYFGDLGGQVWRMDIDSSESSTSYMDDRITAGVIADFGGNGASNRRRFYYPPDIAVVAIAGRQHLSVSIGSGWRAHPLDSEVDDRFYSFRLPDVYGPPLDTMGQIVYTSITEDTPEMIDVTDTLGTDPRNAVGWYISLETSGEKVLAPSIMINRKIIFTTYTPSTVADACSAAVGSGRAYIVDALNGDPVKDLDSTSSNEGDALTKNDRSNPLNHAGIPPPAIILFPEVGKPTIKIGTEDGPGEDIEPKSRTFWQEHLDEDS